MRDVLLAKTIFYFKTFKILGIHISLKLLSGDVEQVREFHVCVQCIIPLANKKMPFLKNFWKQPFFTCLQTCFKQRFPLLDAPTSSKKRLQNLINHSEYFIINNFSCFPSSLDCCVPSAVFPAIGRLLVPATLISSSRFPLPCMEAQQYQW